MDSEPSSRTSVTLFTRELTSNLDWRLPTPQATSGPIARHADVIPVHPHASFTTKTLFYQKVKFIGRKESICWYEPKDFWHRSIFRKHPRYCPM
eukprot:888504-Amorphochlora_amoeboformis.AAC.2